MSNERNLNYVLELFFSLLARNSFEIIALLVRKMFQDARKIKIAENKSFLVQFY